MAQLARWEKRDDWCLLHDSGWTICAIGMDDGARQYELWDGAATKGGKVRARGESARAMRAEFERLEAGDE